MTVVDCFFSPEETKLSREFQENGYVIRDVDNRAALDELRSTIVRLTCSHLNCDAPTDHEEFLNDLHKVVKPEKLNDLRLFVFRSMNELSWLRPTYFSLGRSLLASLVGNELAMQNRVNLSIQMSKDNSSLLDLHSDVYSGETPFQVVQWLPLVSVSGTKSMFILPHAKTKDAEQNLNSLGDGGMSALYEQVKNDLISLTVPYGKVLIFNSNCLHGNVVNETETTRWSMNCRFTGLFTPYVSYEKGLGSFYVPITMRAASRIGISYSQPSGFQE
jgi:sporadic carbohydrate cluster 2OG-Fe(II) oxygenase